MNIQTDLLRERDNLLARNRHLNAARTALENEVIHLAAALISIDKGDHTAIGARTLATAALAEWRKMRREAHPRASTETHPQGEHAEEAAPVATRGGLGEGARGEPGDANPGG